MMSIEPEDLDERLLATHWPMPEAFTVEHLVAAARTARELIRWANHATISASSDVLTYAADVATATSVLSQAADNLSRLAFQLAERAVVIAEEPGLRHDSGGDARQTMLAAAGQLGDAGATPPPWPRRSARPTATWPASATASTPECSTGARRSPRCHDTTRHDTTKEAS